MPRPATIYERMEAQARGVTRSPRTGFLLFGEAALIVLSFLMLGYLLYAAQFSGAVRWALGLALVAAIAFYAVTKVSRETGEPASLAPRPRGGSLKGGELTYLTATLRRAGSGLSYSQVLVSSRAREAFAERARLARGLSPEGMRRLSGDPAALKAVVRDDLLADFLYMPASDREARYRWAREASERGGFEARFRGILDRMEAWR